MAIGLALAGCGAEDELDPGGAGSSPRSSPAVTPAPSKPAAPRSNPAASPENDPGALVVSGPTPSDGRPRRATLSIPAIGLEKLVVEPYRGRTDDGPGTELQDRGLAASPFGPEGGTGPGGIGNYQVTAHRNSSTAAFADLPQLRHGQRVFVSVGGTRLTYKIMATRSTSFRSEASLAEQRAAVPGRPGEAPTRAMITLSTCATQEDHAVGNFWADEFGNPEHRIDKIGVLVASVPITAGSRS